MPTPRELARKLELKRMAAVVMQRDSTRPRAFCSRRTMAAFPNPRRRRIRRRPLNTVHSDSHVLTELDHRARPFEWTVMDKRATSFRVSGQASTASPMAAKPQRPTNSTPPTVGASSANAA